MAIMTAGTVVAEPPTSAASERAWTKLVPVITAATMALVFTLDGYTFGRSNQMEQLSAVLAYLDESLLRRDYFVQFFVEGGPRYYYIRLLALGSHLLALPALFFVLTAASNAATLVITFRTARQLFDSLIAGYSSMLLVGALHFYVRIGDAGFLLTDNLSPATIALPCMFGAISAALRGHTPAAMVWAVGTAIIHPLYGLAAGGSAAFVDGVQLLRRQRQWALGRHDVFSWAARLLGFAVIFALLWYRPSAGPRLDDATYFHIYAVTRGPHHVLPSTWPLRDWVLFANFTLCSLLCLYVVRARTAVLAPLVCLAALVMLGFVVGYVFVELIPLRPIMVAQSYRFTCITSWIGIIFGAGAFASIFEAAQSPRARAWRAAAVGLALTLLVVGERVMFPRRRGVTLVLLVVLALGGWAVQVARRRLVTLSAMLAALTAFGVLRFGVFRERDRWLGHRRPAFTLNDFSTRYDDVATYARAHTDRDAVFAIIDVHKHWESGTFRYRAERALFVDHKVFPYGDPEIAEWYARTSALKVLDPAQNNDAALEELAKRWKVDYAIVPKESPTQLPAAFEGEEYRLLSLRPRG